MAKYFKRSEFVCKCGCDRNPTVDFELLDILYDVREHFGAPVTVNSGFRCKDHNRAVGGSSSSQHLLGKAADIVVKGYEPHEVQTYILHKYDDKYGLGQYDTFTHIDSRPYRARWMGNG